MSNRAQTGKKFQVMRRRCEFNVRITFSKESGLSGDQCARMTIKDIRAYYSRSKANALRVCRQGRAMTYERTKAALVAYREEVDRQSTDPIWKARDGKFHHYLGLLEDNVRMKFALDRGEPKDTYLHTSVEQIAAEVR
jgi:hypothetical protein